MPLTNIFRVDTNNNGILFIQKRLNINNKMGSQNCCGSRKGETLPFAEEAFITIHESSLGLFRYEPTILLQKFGLFSKDKMLSMSDLYKGLNDLSLPRGNDFYEKFEHSEQPNYIDTKKLATLFILLGRDKSSGKARLLFTFYSNKEQITYKEFL